VHAVLNAVPPGRRRIEVGLDEMWRVFRDPIYLAALEVYVGARTDPVKNSITRGAKNESN